MASKAFNAVDGVSVGVDTQINVIDSGGNVTAQTLTVSTTANLGSVDNLVITGGESGQFLQTDGNGNLIFADPAGSVSGSNTQIQFNDNDAFGASANLTFDKSTSTLVVKNSINIGGTDSNISGANNVTANFYFGDGGFLSNIASVTANSISNGSSNVKVYNDSNVAISVAGTSNVVDVTSTGANVAGYVTATGNITATYFLGDGGLLSNISGAGTPNSIANGTSNVVVDENGNVRTSVNGISNVFVVTSTGANLTGNLTVASGNILGANVVAANTLTATNANIGGGTGGNLTGANVISANILNVALNANLGNSVTANFFTGNGSFLTNLTASNVVGTVANANYAAFAGNVTTNAQPNITSLGTLSSLEVNGLANLGQVANITILGGSNNQVLKTDGTGNLSWVTQSGGSGTPGGANTEIQFNDDGSFGGSSAFIFDKTSNAITASGNITANYFIGNGALLTGIATGTPNAIINGNSNVTIDANSDVRVSVAGTSNVLTVTETEANITGNLFVSKKIGVNTSAYTAGISFENNVGPKIDFYYDQTGAGDRYGVDLQSSQLKIYSGAGGAANGGISFGKANTSTFTEAMRIQNNGNVGIGTPTPNSFVTIEKNAGGDYLDLTVRNLSTDNDPENQARIRLTTAGDAIEGTVFGKTYNSGPYGGFAYLWNTENTDLILATNNTERIRILSSGNVGIGIAAPNAKLDVNGNVAANFFIGDGGLLSNITATGGSSITNGTSNVVVDPNSDVRISINSTSNVATFASTGLTIAGSLAATDKSFVIKHPSKENMKLRYGSLESPYHGVRLTGQGEVVNGKAEISLPDYINALVKEEGVNVQLTNIKHDKTLWIEEIDIANNKFVVGGPTSIFNKTFKFYWSFTAIRKDVPDLITEYKE